MKINSARLKAQARGHLSGRYLALIVAFIMANVITNLPSMLLGYNFPTRTGTTVLIEFAVSFLVYLISCIFVVGQDHICLLYARDKAMIPVSEMWFGFKNHADDTIKITVTIFLRYVTTGLPFFALLYYYRYKNPVDYALALVIVSGVITAIIWIRIALSYSLSYFILLDFPSKNTKEILDMSRDMTKSRMWQLFCLICSIIGVYILGLLSFGIGLLWVRPYIRMTLTEFYLNLLPGKQVLDITVDDSTSLNGGSAKA